MFKIGDYSFRWHVVQLRPSAVKQICALFLPTPAHLFKFAKCRFSTANVLFKSEK